LPTKPAEPSAQASDAKPDDATPRESKETKAKAGRKSR